MKNRTLLFIFILLLYSFVFFTPPECHASIIRIQYKTGTGTNGISLTLESPPSSGNTLILTFACYNGGCSGVTQTGVSWSQVVERQGSTSLVGYAEIWKGEVGEGASDSITVSVSTGGTAYASCCIAEYSGVLFGSPETTNSSLGNSANPLTNSVTSTQTSLIIGAFDRYGGGTFSDPTGGFTIVSQYSNVNAGCMTEIINAEAGTYESGVTITSNYWAACIAVFTSEETDTYYLNYSEVNYNSSMLGTNNQMSALWSSNDTLDSYTFEWNFTQALIADSPNSFSNSTPPQYSSVTKDLGANMTKYHYIIAWRINATTINGASNSTGLQYFTLHGINVTYTISENATLRINNTPTSNITVTYPHNQEIEALAVVKAGASLTQFDYNGTSYTDNPSIILYTATDYRNDNYQGFTLYTGTGTGEDVEELFALGIIGVIIGCTVTGVLVYSYGKNKK